MNDIRGGIPIQDHLRAWCLANATSASVLPRRQIAKVRNDRDGGSAGEEPACNAGDQVRFLSLENPLEKE